MLLSWPAATAMVAGDVLCALSQVESWQQVRHVRARFDFWRERLFDANDTTRLARSLRKSAALMPVLTVDE